MKNKLVNLVTIIVVILLINACELNKLPYDSVEGEEVLNSAEGAEAITLGTYSFLKIYTYVKPFHFIPEFASDNVALSGTTTDRLFNIYTFNRVVDNWHVKDFWEGSYRMIVNCNRVIELETADMTEELKQLVGENYYIRGFLYFNMVNAFGRPYSQSPQSNPGVPLKLNSNLEDYPERSTVHAVYEQIISDLKKAETYIEDNSKGNIYATEWAAKALLSRVYLYMQDWNNAKNYADTVITNGGFELLEGSNYQNYNIPVPEQNKETIFAIRHVKDRDFPYESGWEEWSNWNTVGSMYASINGAGWGEMYASKPLRDLLDENITDIRRNWIKPQYDLDEDGNKQYWVIWTETVYINGLDQPIFRYVKVDVDGANYSYDRDGANEIAEKVNVDPNDNTYRVWFWDNTNEIWIQREGQLEYRLLTRNGYPKYFVYKCSLQENQDHMWSPVVSRLAEMYLNRAEANHHLGFDDDAIDDINVIRERAQIPAYNLGSLPMGTVLDVIIQERRLELMYEGHRKFDVFRNGLPMDRNYPGTHTRDGILSIVPSDNHVVLFIPQEALDSYPIPLEQNQ